MANDPSFITSWLTWAFSPSISAILVALTISLLSPVLIHIFLYRQSAAKELPSFLLLGPSGAGKTSLLTIFADGTTPPTHTSQEPQTTLCQLPSSISSAEDKYRSENDTSSRSQARFTLVDTPGHGKLRHHALSSLTSPSALKGLIYVVDSAVLSSSAGLTEAAEYLHDVLLVLQKRHTQGKSSKDPTGIPVLVTANKQDLFTSLPAGIVKSKLELEIAKVRETRSKGLLDSGIGMEDDGGEEETNWLGEYGAKEFAFKQMEEHGVEVLVIGGNARGEGEESGNVEHWWRWVGDRL